MAQKTTALHIERPSKEKVSLGSQQQDIQKGGREGGREGERNHHSRSMYLLSMSLVSEAAIVLPAFSS
jgi:hypothetical protein